MKLLIYTLLSLSLLSRITSQACQRTCGKQPIMYPFGTGPGCGDPRFQKYITCSQNQLTLATHTGCYPITSVDYSSQTIYVYDPTMSTCACTQASRGFSLDWDAPFTFRDNTIFALLDCSTSSLNATSVYCDPNGASVCGLLNSCQAISRLDSPVPTCCVYDPVVLGPTFEMDLQKLQCGSYSGIYGYNGKNSDPDTWSYGVAIKYKFNFNNDYPSICGDCEKSNGTCGYYGKDNSFVCNCPSGLNTSANCFFATPWNSGLMSVPWHTEMAYSYRTDWDGATGGRNRMRRRRESGHDLSRPIPYCSSYNFFISEKNMPSLK